MFDFTWQKCTREDKRFSPRLVQCRSYPHHIPSTGDAKLLFGQRLHLQSSVDKQTGMMERLVASNEFMMQRLENMAPHSDQMEMQICSWFSQEREYPWTLCWTLQTKLLQTHSQYRHHLTSVDWSISCPTVSFSSIEDDSQLHSPDGTFERTAVAKHLQSLPGLASPKETAKLQPVTGSTRASNWPKLSISDESMAWGCDLLNNCSANAKDRDSCVWYHLWETLSWRSSEIHSPLLYTPALRLQKELKPPALNAPNGKDCLIPAVLTVQ